MDYDALTKFTTDSLGRILGDEQLHNDIDFYVLLPKGCLGITTLAPYEIFSDTVCIMPECDNTADDYIIRVYPGYSKLTNASLSIACHNNKELVYEIFGKLLKHRIQGDDSIKLIYKLNLVQHSFEGDEVVRPVNHANRSKYADPVTRDLAMMNPISRPPKAEMYCDLIYFDPEDIFVHDRQSSTRNEQVSPKTENKMLQLILGMAMEAYGYDPYSTSRQNATGENKGSIQARLLKKGINISNDTIKRYLDKAVKEDLCPPKPKEKSNR